MKQYTLGAFVCALSVLTGCNGTTAPGTASSSQTTQPRLKLSEVTFDSPWIKPVLQMQHEGKVFSMRMN